LWARRQAMPGASTSTNRFSINFLIVTSPQQHNQRTFQQQNNLDQAPTTGVEAGGGND